MNTSPDCQICIDKGIAAMLDRLVHDTSARMKTLNSIRALYPTFDLDAPAPENARLAYARFYELTGIADPYQSIKDKSTEYAWKILESIRGEYERQPDPFEAALRLAIAGNIIDFGANVNLTFDGARSSILQAFSEELSPAGIAELREKIRRAQKILYIMDNCGEAVFDGLFLKPFAAKTTIAVRGNAILNDITRREIAASGLNIPGLRIVDTGDGTPGVSLHYAGKEFLDAFHSADLILCKGQGNYETLEGRGEGHFAYLFRAKCPVLFQKLKCRPSAMQIIFEKRGPARTERKDNAS